MIKPAKRVLFIDYKYWGHNPRAEREAAALMDAGYGVDVICPRHDEAVHPRMPEGVRFYSPLLQRKRGSRLRYMFEYGYFILYATVCAFWLRLRRRYVLLQVFTMPEALMVCALPARLLGARVLMDWMDPTLEVYLAKYENKSGGIILRLIRMFEWMGSRLADRIITPNIGFERVFVERGHAADKMSIVMNGPDRRIFPDAGEPPAREETRPFRILFNGTVLHRHGLHVALQALAVVQASEPDFVLEVVSSGEQWYIDECRALAKTLGLEGRVRFGDRVMIDEVPALLRSATMGLIPNLDNPFTHINFPQRLMEYAITGTPVVVSRLPGIEDYLSGDDVKFFTPGDADAMAAAILELLRSSEARRKLAACHYQTNKALVWEEPFIEVVAAMIGPAQED